MTMPLPVERTVEDAAAIRAGIAMERLLNTWLRERMTESVPVEGEACTLNVGANRLRASCLQASPGGFHRWRLPVLIEGADGSATVANDPIPVANLMTEALAQENGSVSPAVRERLIKALNGAEEHALACAARPVDLSPMGLEQSLWHGHPFHPFAKSIDGFSADDIDCYAPERARGFQLRWIIAEADVGAALWRDGQAKERVNRILTDLSGLPEKAIGGRLLIPSHPWQAARLENDPSFADLVERGRAILTLPNGATMQPTSSVRTVFAPGANIFVKLPIAARITNFARTNPRDQIARSMAAGRALAAIAEQVTACGLDTLDEPGAVWIDRPGLEAITGVVLREAPARDAFVLAGLLEPSPHDGRPMLAAMGCDLSNPAAAQAWLRAYVQTATLPPLRLFARTGVSLEAHSQNSLLALDRGNPARLIVRDLEGVSIDRERFEHAAPDLELDPSVFFPAAEARQRLVYYLVSNQLNHVVAAVSRLADAPEGDLWGVIAEALSTANEDREMATLITWLLEAETLPAKANFTSCFARRSERPDYVEIPNPLRRAVRDGHALPQRTVALS
ncbi:IucA/IucC family protein [Rhizorhapis suberifaciens]|uniref:Siderophore synthetase component n=1 Tax=Rhizorhapis suberifaciens TaxID=13656 RepID=A0A840HU20_9SPHN|nr:IucA/IucC family protein [Rhizorhapis suberifaciens]MBB4641423.1 siderophore synthetase component [Rhizorhapis suberifaciens]